MIREGFKVNISLNGKVALKDFNQFDPNLIILDRMLPKKSGEEVLNWIKRIKDIPVIMLTAKDKETDIIEGFKKGVDDYITKPFSPKVLVYRVKTVLKRYDFAEFKENIFYKQLKIYPNNMEVYLKNKKINLSKKEFDILYLLAKNPERIYSRDQIINLVSNNSENVYDRTVDAHIKNIRKKIKKIDKKRKYIYTVYGKGYKFVNK